MDEKSEAMKSSDFQKRHPKPWRFVMFGISCSLKDANGKTVGSLCLSANHQGIPQQEWNRHVAEALREYIPVEQPDQRPP